MGGAQYVLGNLWDVTDKDIDKLSMECMRMFFEDSVLDTDIDGSDRNSKKVGLVTNQEGVRASIPLAQALATSRNVCKLKSAVGCAPVIYGIPKKYVNS